MNLFTSTQSLSSSHMEDHLTEFIAAALLLDQGFRDSFAAILLGEHAKAKGWEPPRIVGVETQVSYPGTGCCPDMRLTLADGKRILCEHKIEAIETEGKENKEDGQIGRYLKLPSDGVAYIRASWKPPKGAVLDNPLYVKPVGREHFLWSDFHGALSGGLFLDWIRTGFDHMGFTPPLPGVGDLRDPDEMARKRNCIKFAEHWRLTMANAEKMGWSSETNVYAELYMGRDTGGLASAIFVSPVFAARFLVRVTPRDGQAPAVLSAVEKALSALGSQGRVVQRKVPRAAGKVEVVDIESSLHDVLGGVEGPEDKAKALWALIGGILAALDAHAPSWP
jgi:hypothetical protein